MDQLLPCPKCGNQVVGHVYGCVAAFGCGEYTFEAECSCGIQFDDGPYDTPEEAEIEGAKAWNTRYDPSECGAQIIWDSISNDGE